MKYNSDASNPFAQDRNRKLIVGGLGAAAIVLVAGVVLTVRHQASQPIAARQAVIEITPTGFVPAALSVKAGTAIVWRNVDSAPHAVGGDPYPADTSVPGLKSRTILPSGSYMYRAQNSGVISYHDDLTPTHSGTITVGK